MGFPPIDARATLLNSMTENGFNVQAATELSLSQAGQEGSTLSLHPPERERRRNVDRGGYRDRAEKGGPLRYTRRGLQLTALRMVRQLRIADHDGCATVIMRVVRWVQSRKDPVLPEPCSRSPQHSRTAVPLMNIERLLSENVDPSPQRFQRTGT